MDWSHLAFRSALAMHILAGTAAVVIGLVALTQPKPLFSEGRGHRRWGLLFQRLMIAVIGDSAQTPSIELHRAAGFKMVGTFEGVGYKFDRWLDSVLMQRPLGKGRAAPP